MTRRAVVALGIGQCVNWGVLYYAFAILVLPVGRELGLPTWVVTGAFSLALLMSAAVAPAIGRWSDAGHGASLIQAGSVGAAVLLCTWAFLPGLATLYAVWAGLGLCMAATLYEPVFAIVGRAYEDPVGRLRALAAVTVFGGLASTIFLPATAFLTLRLGWRGAVLVLAAVLMISTAMTRLLVFRGMRPVRFPVNAAGSGNTAGPTPRSRFGLVLVMFSTTTLASAGFITNLVPALHERAVPPTTAALLGGLLGLMQVPGRALLMSGTLGDSPARLVRVTFLLQACGLAGLALAPSVGLIGLGVMVFAVGAGLTTLVRPHVVQTMFTLESAGYLNGQIARAQQLARAAGPILLASFASVASYAAALLVLACAFAVLAWVSRFALPEAPSTPVRPGAST